MITGSITITARVHPNTPFNLNTSIGLSSGEVDGRYIVLYVPAIIKTVTAVSGSITVNQFAYGTRWFWSSVVSGAQYVDSNSVTDITQLPSKFTDTSKQLIVCRQAFRNGGSSWGQCAVTAISCTITGTFEKIDTVSAGTQITNTTMVNLKNYLDSMATYLCMGTGTTITAPGSGNPIDNSNWTNYITKANALPHVSGLAIPSEGNSISASYYNGIASAVNP